VPGGGVRWGIQAISYGDTDTIDSAGGSAQEVTDNNVGSESNRFRLSDWTSAATAALTPTGGEDLHFRIYRDPTHGDDTLDTDARLRSVRIEFQRSAFSD
jgi:hypothetical protein